MYWSVPPPFLEHISCRGHLNMCFIEGGSTFCGVAALALMRELDSTFSPSQLEGLRRWCIQRQQTGFQGRPNKAVDTCYSFWIGATLQVRGVVLCVTVFLHQHCCIQLLGSAHLVDSDWNRRYVLSTQGDYGGLSKWPDYTPGEFS